MQTNEIRKIYEKGIEKLIFQNQNNNKNKYKKIKFKKLIIYFIKIYFQKNNKNINRKI